MVALSTWAFAFQMHQATGTDGTTSQVPPCQKQTFLFGMPVWQNDEMTLEGQGRQQKYYEDDNMAWANCLGRPIGVQLPWPHRPAQGQTNTTML